MKDQRSAQHTVRTIRLDDSRIGEILDGLDEAGSGHIGQRESQRYRYRMKAVVVHMQQPGAGSAVPFLVPTRDLSEGGLAFLHGGFVHPRTRCLVQLITSHGTWNNAVGRVVGCRHVEGNIHSVSLHFDQLVDPSMYCAEAAHCRVLLAEDDPAIARLTIFHLEQLNAKVDHVVDGRAAIAAALENAYDLILMDMEMPVVDGFGATTELRGKGYTGMIVAATALTGQSDRERCFTAGCDRYIAKPFARDDLANLIKTLREEPLFSSYAGDAAMTDLLNTFVMELPAKIRALEEASASKDLKALESLTRALKAQGGSYGFEIITETAQQIETALLEGSTVDGVQTDVEQLVKFCLLARASAKLGHPLNTK